MWARDYLSWSWAGSWLSQLSLVLIQSLFGSLILWVEEQDTQGIFHGLRHVPHWRWGKVGRGQQQSGQNKESCLSPGKATSSQKPQRILKHTFNSRAQRRGRGEEIQAGEATRAEGPSAPSELCTVVSKDPILKRWSPGALTVELSVQSQVGKRRDRRASEWQQRHIFPPRVHPSQADPEHRPHAVPSAGWEGSQGQGSCDQDGWLHLPHSAAGTAEPGSSVLQRRQTSRGLCMVLPGIRALPQCTVQPLICPGILF